MALNKWLGIGRLVATPELRTTQSGISVCGFRIAVNRQYRKDVEQEADFLNIVAWRSSAEFVCKYFDKGDPIQITGSVQTRSYTDKDGKEVYVTEIVADEISFVEGASKAKRDNDTPTNSGIPEPQMPNNDGFMPIPDFGDDDLPF